MSTWVLRYLLLIAIALALAAAASGCAWNGAEVRLPARLGPYGLLVAAVVVNALLFARVTARLVGGSEA